MICLIFSFVGCKKLHPTRSNPPSNITNIFGSISDVRTDHSPYMELYVKITDQNNTPIIDFQIGDFAITENNTPLPIDSITYSRTPLSVVLVLDRSGSMDDGSANPPYKQLNEAVIGFINALSLIDMVEIIDFGTTVEISKEFTNDKNELIDTINSHGADMVLTHLWEAAGIGVEEVQKGFGYKLLLVMTDGGDYSSAGTKYPDVYSVANYAKSINQPVYCIGYGTLYDPELQYLAQETGGAFSSASSAQDLTQIYNSFIPTEVDHTLLHYRTREKGTKKVEVYLNYGVFSEKFTSQYSS